MKPRCTGPFLVALAGIPGSGKTSSATLLSNILSGYGISNIVVPMDGYHYSLDYLRSLDDAEDKIYRRGAPDTFDANALKRDLRYIRDENSNVLFPGFDHAAGDPEPNCYEFIRSQHKVVICEGLYLLYENSAWEGIANMFDYRIFIKADIDKCIERLKVRNRCIPGYTEQEIDIRCDKVDRDNALIVQDSCIMANEIVQSVVI